MASLVEVGGGLPIIQLFELLGDFGILLKTLLDVLIVLSVSFTLVVLCLLEIVTESQQRVLGLLKACLACTLI